MTENNDIDQTSDLNRDAAQHIGFSQEDLLKLARWQMPFGKYAGRVLIDLPEEYLFWFQKNEFPKGELGDLMRLCLDLKIEGLDDVLRPLKN